MLWKAFKITKSCVQGFTMDTSVQGEWKVIAEGQLQLTKDGISRKGPESAAQDHDGHDRKDNRWRLEFYFKYSLFKYRCSQTYIQSNTG